MKNFAKKSFVEKKTWGVLGKIQEFYSPEQFQDETRIVPLNANPLEAWDSNRSRYRRRVQGPLPNDFQQGGVVPQETPSPDITPTPTPSSTPVLPEIPALWYDSTNLGSIDYITSGGTDYIVNWRSIGTESKTLTGETANAPTWISSSEFPNSPLVARFTGGASPNYLTQRFDTSSFDISGTTVYAVFAKPSDATYDRIIPPGEDGFNFALRYMSGNTNTGGWFNVAQTTQLIGYNNASANVAVNNFNSNGSTFTSNITFSGDNIGDKFLHKSVYNIGSQTALITINDVEKTNSAMAPSQVGRINQISLGALYNLAGVIIPTNMNAEVAEIMIFNRGLSDVEQIQVETYLKNKWDYSGWPPPTPTPTATPTMTPTNTETPTPTPTPSSTPPPFSPSGLTDLQQWYLSTDGASVSQWDNKGLLGGFVSQGTGSLQPQIVSSTLGSFSGDSVQYTSRDFMSGGFTSTNYSSSTVFAVMKIIFTDGSGWSIDLSSVGTNNNAWSWQSFSTSSTSIARKNPGSSTSPTRIKTPLLLATSGESSSFFTASFNDVLGTSGTTTFTGTTANNLNFGYNPGSSSSTNIEIFEFLIYNRVLTTSEYSQVMDYLKTKYQYNTW